MAKISFTQKDLARMRQPEVGWHQFEITGQSEAAAKAKDSINYTITFEVVQSAVDDTNKGRAMERLFNSKPAAKPFLVGFLAAAWAISEDETVDRITELVADNEDLDLEIFVGKKVWNEVVEEPFEGRMVRKMGDNWLSGEESPPF